MSAGKRRGFCEGGSPVIPCPHNGWVRLHPFGQMEEAKVVCGKHYRSVTVAMIKQYRSMIIVQEV